MRERLIGALAIRNGSLPSLVFLLMLAFAGCSSRIDASGAAHASGGRAVAGGAHASIYRGPAIVTGKGPLAACPRRFDLDQYLNDMANLRVDPNDPGYEVARDYDLRNRQCIELRAAERVDIEGGRRAAESLVRPLDRSQPYWTAADWLPAADPPSGVIRTPLIL